MQSSLEHEFNTELFIHEIQNRPALWDTSKGEYSDRPLKKKAWEEICNLFIPQFEAKTIKQKNEEALKIQKKWKSIRDRYARERKNMTKSGSGASTSREYLYSKYLTFLNPLSRIRPKNVPPGHSSDNHSQKEKSKENNEEKLLDILYERMRNKCNEKVNRDQQFFMSLVEDFGNIHSDYKMDAKIEILGIMKKYLQMSKYTGQNQNQQGYFTSNLTMEASTPSSNSYSAVLTQDVTLQSDDTSQESLYGDLFSVDDNSTYVDL